MEEKSKQEVKKKVTIIVNASPFNVEKDDMSYNDVVTLAFPDFPKHPDRTYSVTYERGQGNKPVMLPAPGEILPRVSVR